MTTKTSDKLKMPRAPIKLASIEDVSRYLTTVTKMLHNDLITPSKANSLRALCLAKLESFKRNQDSGTKVQINIGLPLGSGKKGNVIEVSDDTEKEKPLVMITGQTSIDEELRKLETDIEKVLNDE